MKKRGKRRKRVRLVCAECGRSIRECPHLFPYLVDKGIETRTCEGCGFRIPEEDISPCCGLCPDCCCSVPTWD